MKEEWKDIEGHDHYKVSNLGRVKRTFRYKNGEVTERFLNTHKKRTDLCIYLDRTSKALDKLVASAFVEKPNSSFEYVAHKDGNPYNNIASNLEWRKFRNRPILMISLYSHQVLRIYEGAVFAEQSTGISRYAIFNCLNGQSKTAGGFIWCYFNWNALTLGHSNIRCGTKTCIVCGKELPINDFKRNRFSPDGFVSTCKTCVAKKYRETRNKKQH